MFVCINGKLVEKKHANVPICDHGFLYGDAVYETIRTHSKGRPWLLNEHLKRLRNSARFLGIRVTYNNKKLSDLITRLHKKNGFKESRIRITLSRGCNDFEFNNCRKPFLLITCEKLKLPSSDVYEKGVKVITKEAIRTAPLIKSTSMLPTNLVRKELDKNKAFEVFLLDDKGNITEGSISNIFAVQKGVMITPKDNILEGTVRNYIIKKFRKKYSVKFANIKLNDIKNFDEVFLTSTIKGAIPVVKIDNKKVGNGIVGPVTKEIMSSLWK